MANAKKSKAPAPAHDEPMAENNMPVHTATHNSQEADLYFGDDIHAEDMAEENWVQPQVLEAPPPRAGFVQRWIRRSMIGAPDAQNMVKQGQSGWRPRALENVPMGIRKNFATVKDRSTSGMFMINGDLILCEMPQRKFEQMQDYFRQRAKSQVRTAVDDDLAATADRRGKAIGLGDPEVVERSSRVSTRKPIVAADK